MRAPAWAFVAVDWNGTVVPFFGRPAHADVLHVLAQIRAGGVPVFVVSRAPQSVIAADVRRTGLVADEVYGCTDKAPVLSALRAQHGPGLLVGDTQGDQIAADRAGVAFLQARLEGEEPLEGADSFTAWSAAAPLLLAGGAGLG